jgi:glycosyltransferase involved in cell wall biosynthesis
VSKETNTAGFQDLEFSLVVPLLNEEPVLRQLLRELAAQLDAWVRGRWEVILVDDGSSDGSRDLIVERNKQDGRFKGLLLSRNFGHQAALSIGLACAGGRFVGVIDADLQDPPEVLRKLYETCVTEKANVAFGVRTTRDAPFVLQLCYRIFYRFMNRFSDHPWPMDAGDFCVLDRKAVAMLRSLPESNRVLRGLRSWIGLRQVAIPYERPRRRAGSSKYNFAKLANLASDSVVGFSAVPLQIAVWSGLTMSALCLLLMLLFLLNRLFPRFTLLGYYLGANPGIATIAILLTLVSAINFLCLGIIGQYLAVVLKEVKRRPQAIVERVVGQLQQRNGGHLISNLPTEKIDSEAPNDVFG